MQLRARLIVNGAYIAGSDTWSYSDVRDGQYVLRLPDGICYPGQYVALEIQLHGLATIEELESRISGLERALRQSQDHYLGIWLPRLQDTTLVIP